MSERDIVERLRWFAEAQKRLVFPRAETLREAADEIERLRSAPGEAERTWNRECVVCAYKWTEATPGAIDCPRCYQKRVAAPSHDLEALREALEEIAALDWRYASTNMAAYEAHKIARRALSQHVGGEG